MKEQEVEKHLVDGIRRLGGLSFKINSQGNNGLPDRLCIFPGGRMVFAELKRPKGGRLSPVQREQQRRLRALGVAVVNLSTVEAVDGFLKGVVV